MKITYQATLILLMAIFKIVQNFLDDEKHKSFYCLDSPTGTGKTISYILASIYSDILFRNQKYSTDDYFVLNTIVFTNTQALSL